MLVAVLVLMLATSRVGKKKLSDNFNRALKNSFWRTVAHTGLSSQLIIG